ncbi:MAG: hypothetical protein ACE37F_11405 [Nannocystaceae bacterium]|nr:hypothetical protein [bacterium]
MTPVSDDQRAAYVSLFVLKLLDLAPEDGGVAMPVLLPASLTPFEPVLERLAVEGLVEIDRKRGEYRLTQPGLDTIAMHIDEAEGYIEEFDDVDVGPMLRVLRQRNVDPMRVRFLWGWYQGEFDDPVVFQQRRGVAHIERDWASYIQSDAFFAAIAEDLAE